LLLLLFVAVQADQAHAFYLEVYQAQKRHEKGEYHDCCVLEVVEVVFAVDGKV
jgi:hypothetical protein